MAKFDVVAVEIKTGKVRVMQVEMDERNADAYVGMAVMRRGVAEEIFSAVPAGAYSDGDEWRGRNPRASE